MSENNNNTQAVNNSPEDVKLVLFSGQRIPVPSHLTVQQIKDGLVSMFPRIADAIAQEDSDGNVRFYVEAGEKGADESEESEVVGETIAPSNEDVKLVLFSGQRIPVPSHLTVQQIKDGLVSMFPRIADAIAQEDSDGNVRFYVEAGEKGYTV